MFFVNPAPYQKYSGNFTKFVKVIYNYDIGELFGYLPGVPPVLQRREKSP